MPKTPHQTPAWRSHEFDTSADRRPWSLCATTWARPADDKAADDKAGADKPAAECPVCGTRVAAWRRGQVVWGREVGLVMECGVVEALLLSLSEHVAAL